MQRGTRSASKNCGHAPPLPLFDAHIRSGLGGWKDSAGRFPPLSSSAMVAPEHFRPPIPETPLQHGNYRDLVASGFFVVER